MKVEKFPHSCSTRLLAGFDQYNGTHSPGSDARDEVGFFRDFVEGMNGACEPGCELQLRGWTVRGVGNVKVFIATTHSEQTRGKNFLRKLGFTRGRNCFRTEDENGRPMCVWYCDGNHLHALMESLRKDCTHANGDLKRDKIAEFFGLDPKEYSEKK